MSGSGVIKRGQATARQAARLARDGKTYRQIAEATGLKIETIKTRIMLGERLLSLENK